MSVVVLDTNILLRLTNPSAPEHLACRAAITNLAETGAVLAIVPQVLVEFWVVATRPAEVNGLGWTPALTHTAISGFLSQFQLVPKRGRHSPVGWTWCLSIGSKENEPTTPASPPSCLPQE
ncbi:MAG: hypothetical protein SFV15_13200 [Polyangiaceae bacterium]|nr:hypothetical protein [Polyangiaceae bacterium]